MKLTPSEEMDLKSLLATYRQSPNDTLASERRAQDIIRWINTTIEGRAEEWERQLDEALESLG